MKFPSARTLLLANDDAKIFKTGASITTDIRHTSVESIAIKGFIRLIFIASPYKTDSSLNLLLIEFAITRRITETIDTPRPTAVAYEKSP